MSTEPLLELNFEPDGTRFIDGYHDDAEPAELSFEPDHTKSIDEYHDRAIPVLCSSFVTRPIAVNDGRFISTEEIRKSSISIYLKLAQHGFYSGTPASLLVFEFKFLTPHTKNRIKYASIDIEFNSSVATSTKPPHIYAYCPEHIVGDESKRTITTENNLGISSSGNGLVGINAGTSRSEEIEMPSRFRLLSMIKKASEDGSRISGIQWVLNENESTKGGMPHVLSIALVIHRNDEQNIIADVNIAARISSSLSPTTWFGMHACMPRPISIDVTKQIGTAVQVDALELMDINTLIALPDYI